MPEPAPKVNRELLDAFITEKYSTREQVTFDTKESHTQTVAHEDQIESSHSEQFYEPIEDVNELGTTERVGTLDSVEAYGT